MAVTYTGKRTNAVTEKKIIGPVQIHACVMFILFIYYLTRQFSQ